MGQPQHYKYTSFYLVYHVTLLQDTRYIAPFLLKSTVFLLNSLCQSLRPAPIPGCVYLFAQITFTVYHMLEPSNQLVCVSKYTGYFMNFTRLIMQWF